MREQSPRWICCIVAFALICLPTVLVVVNAEADAAATTPTTAAAATPSRSTQSSPPPSPSPSPVTNPNVQLNQPTSTPTSSSQLSQSQHHPAAPDVDADSGSGSGNTRQRLTKMLKTPIPAPVSEEESTSDDGGMRKSMAGLQGNDLTQTKARSGKSADTDKTLASTIEPPQIQAQQKSSDASSSTQPDQRPELKRKMARSQPGQHVDIEGLQKSDVGTPTAANGKAQSSVAQPLPLNTRHEQPQPSPGAESAPNSVKQPAAPSTFDPAGANAQAWADASEGTNAEPHPSPIGILPPPRSTAAPVSVKNPAVPSTPASDTPTVGSEVKEESWARPSVPAKTAALVGNRQETQEPQRSTPPPAKIPTSPQAEAPHDLPVVDLRPPTTQKDADGDEEEEPEEEEEEEEQPVDTASHLSDILKVSDVQMHNAHEEAMKAAVLPSPSSTKQPSPSPASAPPPASASRPSLGQSLSPEQTGATPQSTLPMTDAYAAYPTAKSPASSTPTPQRPTASPAATTQDDNVKVSKKEKEQESEAQMQNVKKRHASSPAAAKPPNDRSHSAASSIPVPEESAPIVPKPSVPFQPTALSAPKPAPKPAPHPGQSDATELPDEDTQRQDAMNKQQQTPPVDQQSSAPKATPNVKQGSEAAPGTVQGPSWSMLPRAPKLPESLDIPTTPALTPSITKQPETPKPIPSHLPTPSTTQTPTPTTTTSEPKYTPPTASASPQPSTAPDAGSSERALWHSWQGDEGAVDNTPTDAPVEGEQSPSVPTHHAYNYIIDDPSATTAPAPQADLNINQKDSANVASASPKDAMPQTDAQTQPSATRPSSASPSSSTEWEAPRESVMSDSSSTHSGLVLMFALLSFCVFAGLKARKLLAEEENAVASVAAAANGGVHVASEADTESGSLLTNGSASPPSAKRPIPPGQVRLDALTDEEDPELGYERSALSALHTHANGNANGNANGISSTSPTTHARGMSLKPQHNKAQRGAGGRKARSPLLGAKLLEDDDSA